MQILINLLTIVAHCALVQGSKGESVVDVVPFIIPLVSAHFMGITAYAETELASVNPENAFEL